MNLNCTSPFLRLSHKYYLGRLSELDSTSAHWVPRILTKAHQARILLHSMPVSGSLSLADTCLNIPEWCSKPDGEWDEVPVGASPTSCCKLTFSFLLLLLKREVFKLTWFILTYINHLAFLNLCINLVILTLFSQTHKYSTVVRLEISFFHIVFKPWWRKMDNV